MSNERTLVAFAMLIQQDWEARVAFWSPDCNFHLISSSRFKTPVLKAPSSLLWPNMACCQAPSTQMEISSFEINRNSSLPWVPPHSTYSLLIEGVIFAYQTHMELQYSVLQEWSWMQSGNHLPFLNRGLYQPQEWRLVHRLCLCSLYAWPLSDLWSCVFCKIKNQLRCQENQARYKESEVLKRKMLPEEQMVSQCEVEEPSFCLAERTVSQMVRKKTPM